jgi:hypothetical protein
VAFTVGVAALTAGAFALLPGLSTFVANLLSAGIRLPKALCVDTACPCDRVHARHVHDGTVPPPLRSNGAKVCSADIYRMFMVLLGMGRGQAKEEAGCPGLLSGGRRE